jgi:phosphoenolpyruvate carboxylase
MRAMTLLEKREPTPATSASRSPRRRHELETWPAYSGAVSESTPSAPADLVGRLDAEQAIPESMRAHVRALGEILGRVLRESGSPGLFEDVERLRLATIQAYTDETPEAFAHAVEIADSFAIARAEEVARAFTVYFHLVNLAEEHQRVSQLRRRAGGSTRVNAADSVATAFDRLAGEIGDETAIARLQAIRFHPVFTAHPTEARRRAVADSIRRLARRLTGRPRCDADRAQSARRSRHTVADSAAAPGETHPRRRGPLDHGGLRRNALYLDPLGVSADR